MRAESVVRRIACGVPLILALAVALALASPAHAATITVNSTADVEADDGQCTLREAITAANTDTASGSEPGECAAGSGGDEITFDLAPGEDTITLGGTQLWITSNLKILGPGADRLTVSGGNSSRVFLLNSSRTVEISGLTITGGNPGRQNLGGGIRNSGNMTVSESTVTGNQSELGGGGIYNRGDLTVIQSTVSGNQASVFGNGAGILNGANLTVSESTVSGNHGSFFGGGISNEGGRPTLFGPTEADMTVSRSTVSGNRSGGGGGIHNLRGDLTVNQSP